MRLILAKELVALRYSNLIYVCYENINISLTYIITNLFSNYD